MSNTVPVTYDAESEAYLARYPELRPFLAVYGSGGAKLHYNTHGKNEGRTWGVAAPVQAVAAGPVKTASTEPLPASYGTDANSWDAYLKSARTATEGMNQMPGVFSDYGAIPTDDAAARALFYPQSSSQSGGQPQPAAMSALTSLTGMSQAVGALSPSQQFNRILDMGQGAFETPAHQMVDQRGGSIAPEELAFYIKGRDYYGL